MLIELWPTRDHLAVFVVDRNGLAVHALPVTEEMLQEWTATFRVAEGAGVRETELDVALARLASQLLPVLTPHLPPPVADDRVSHILFVPSGVLHLWPLWALPLPDTGERLLDRYACTVLPAAEALVWLRQPQSAGAYANAPNSYYGFAHP